MVQQKLQYIINYIVVFSLNCFDVLRILYLGCLAHLFPEILVVEFSMKNIKCTGQA